MVSSIQVSNELKEELQKRKLHDNETYEEIIWDLIEDSLELSEETKQAIETAQKEYEDKKTLSHEEVLKELGL
ncbi:MAG: hypothetical protein INQ03_00845 [Candidatus Heimdallarchaeota archaeon]|nr:hypothetical protein [Candidatus Heimdallarchaeota archaeon]